jgi:hypothetical protein
MGTQRWRIQVGKWELMKTKIIILVLGGNENYEEHKMNSSIQGLY